MSGSNCCFLASIQISQEAGQVVWYSRLLKVKEEREKVGLKFNFQKMKIMAAGPITSWQIDGETVEAVSDFIFGGLQKNDL